MKEPLAVGGKQGPSYFYATPTKHVVWNGDGARESFYAHLKAEARKEAIRKAALP